MVLSDEFWHFFSFFSFKSHFQVIFGLFWWPPEAPYLDPMYPYGPWPQVLLLTHYTVTKNHSFHGFCMFKQVYILKNRIFLLIWAHLEPPTGAQILFNNCVWSHTPSFMFWQEEQL